MKRKYADGGEIDGPTYGEDERPAPTGMSEAAELMPEKPKTFKEAFAEARKAGDKGFTWQGKKYTTELASSRSALPVAGRPRGESVPDIVTSSADIPTGSPYTAPASTGEDTSGPSNLDRVLLGLGAGGAGVAGAAKLMQMRRAKQAAEAAEVAKRFSSPQARQATTETGRRFSPKAEMEAAESTVRGAAGRKDIQAKRALEESKGRAKAIEKNKPVMQASPKKASPRSRTRDEEPEYELRARGGKIGYAKGGSVRGWGQARGARKAQNY